MPKSPRKKPSPPGSRSGGCQIFRPSRRELETVPGEGAETASRSPARPWTPQPPPAQSVRGPASPMPPPHPDKDENLAPQPDRSASRCTPRQVHPSPRPRPQLRPPRCPSPRGNLLVRVCFFGHFLVHLDACPAAGSFAPFIFLCARPPSSHLRRSPDLVGVGVLEMKGRRSRRGSGATRAPRARSGEGVHELRRGE